MSYFAASAPYEDSHGQSYYFDPVEEYEAIGVTQNIVSPEVKIMGALARN